VVEAPVCSQNLLSRQFPCRPTSIATTALPFMVRVGPEAAVSVRMVAQIRDKGVE
jgi:hypothetical protein